jgi:hypothetical protein
VTRARGGGDDGFPGEEAPGDPREEKHRWSEESAEAAFSRRGAASRRRVHGRRARARSSRIAGRRRINLWLGTTSIGAPRNQIARWRRLELCHRRLELRRPEMEGRRGHEATGQRDGIASIWGLGRAELPAAAIASIGASTPLIGALLAGDAEEARRRRREEREGRRHGGERDGRGRGCICFCHLTVGGEIFFLVVVVTVRGKLPHASPVLSSIVELSLMLSRELKC